MVQYLFVHRSLEEEEGKANTRSKRYILLFDQTIDFELWDGTLEIYLGTLPSSTEVKLGLKVTRMTGSSAPTGSKWRSLPLEVKLSWDKNGISVSLIRY